MNGLPLYIIGGIVLFFGLLFFFFRYILVAFTKKELRPLIVTRFTRLFYLGVAIVGLLLFFSGMIVSLTGSMDYKYVLLITLIKTKISKSLKDTQSSLKNNGQSVEDKTVEFNTFSTQINVIYIYFKLIKNIK